MSADDATPDGPDLPDIDLRDDALQDLRAVRDYARYKSLGDGRIRDPERARLRVKYLNVLVSAARAERMILKDRDLEDMADRLDQLEAAVERQGWD